MKTNAALIPSMIFFLLCAFVPASNAQETTKGISIEGTFQYNFISKINAKPYRLSIALPFGYSQTDTTRYPVMYILDGDPNLALATLIQRTMSYDGEVPNIIIVGIGYQVENFLASRSFRAHDYTPTNDAKTDSAMTASHHIKMVSGGAADFLRVMDEEVILFVDQSYKTNHDRLLAGHSYGGLFTAYSLLHKPKLFNRYLISSPSLGWGGGEIIKEEAHFFAAGHKDLAAQVFISAGSSEPDEMIPDVKQLVKILRSRNYKGLEITERIFDNETHFSVTPFALSRGLRVLYNTGIDKKQ